MAVPVQTTDGDTRSRETRTHGVKECRRVMSVSSASAFCGTPPAVMVDPIYTMRRKA